MLGNLCLSCGGEVPIDALDAWFARRFYLQSYAMTEREWDTLFTALRRAFAQGDLQGYDFLFAMPEPEYEEWVMKVRRDVRRLQCTFPEDWRPTGVLETFNKVRAYRKERSRLKRLESATRKKQAL